MNFRVVYLFALSASLFATDSRALFERARELERAGDWAASEALYREVLKQAPSSAEVVGNLGVVLARQEKFDEAISMYRRALRLHPALYPLHLNLGLACYKIGQRPEAIREFRLYLARDADNRQARQMLATALLESDQYEEAAKIFDSLMPSEDLSLQLGLATSLVRLQRVSEARKILDNLLKDDESAEVQLVLGQAYVAATEFEQADRALRRAIQLKPGLAGARFYLGALRWKQQNEEEAIAAWREELKLDGNSFETLFALGAVLAEKGQFDEAGRLLVQARAKRPRHAATLYFLGKIAWKRGDTTALNLLEESVRLDPKNRQARYLLGQIYAARGRRADAAREYAAVRTLGLEGVQQEIDILAEIQ